MLTHKRAGYGVITSPNGITEMDTCTCKHCNKVWIVRDSKSKKQDLGGWCRTCQAMICSKCAGKPCKPFEKKLDEYEAKMKFVREFKNAT